jgi:hypothetical protein
LQADKLDEGVNGRYFINPPAGSPEAGNKNIVYASKSEGFDTIGFEESVWVAKRR